MMITYARGAAAGQLMLPCVYRKYSNFSFVTIDFEFATIKDVD